MFLLTLLICTIVRSSYGGGPSIDTYQEKCYFQLYPVTHNDIYNGLDPKITGNNPGSAKSMMLGGDQIENKVQNGDSIDLVFNFNVPIKVHSLSFKSATGRRADIVLLDKSDNIVKSDQIRQRRGLFTITFDNLYFVKTVRINMKVPKALTEVDVSDIKLMICKDEFEVCSDQDWTLEKWSYNHYNFDFMLTSTDLEQSDVEVFKVLKGSGSKVIDGCASSVYTALGSDTTIEIKLLHRVSLMSVSLESHNVKSVSIKMYDGNDIRLYRDTTVVPKPELLSQVIQSPILKVQSVWRIEIELRIDQVTEKVGVQNLVLDVCLDLDD